MTKTWEEMNQSIHKLLNRMVKPEDFPSDLLKFNNLLDEIDDLVRSSMGIPAEEYHKVLDQAAKMMEPYDPDRTYRHSLITFEPENAAKYYRKLHPNSTKIIN